jgi:hypothetical protein
MHRAFLRLVAVLVVLSLGTGFARASFDAAWLAHEAEHSTALLGLAHDHDDSRGDEGGLPMGEGDHAFAHAAAQALAIPGPMPLQAPVVQARAAPAIPYVAASASASVPPPFRPPRHRDA